MDSQTTKTMFSSKSNEWATPQAFYERLNEVHKFTLDPCADAENKKCEKFYTADDNGLAHSWQGETVFMNPPYGRQIKHWIYKAYQEAAKRCMVAGAIMQLVAAVGEGGERENRC